jgi:hypothetical protein
MRAWLGLLVSIAACGPSPRADTGDDDGTGCVDGSVRCADLTAQTCVGGMFVDTEACATGCTDGHGCSVCTPGTATCNGDTQHACADDGSGYVDTLCDPVQGMTCESGQCTGVCSPDNLGTSYIGCDYYPTVTGNTAGEAFDYAVAIANTTMTDADITIDGGALTMPMTVTVPANQVRVQVLPWQQALKLCDTMATGGCEQTGMPSAALAVRGAYHLRSTQPVTVYQFNALQYSKDGVTFSFSNDASLLMPTNVWHADYYAAAWRAEGPNPSELAVTAMRDNTQVTIVARASTLPGGGAPGFQRDVPQTVTLNAGDVLEITSSAGDLTGSRITSDKEIQVISGHFCADVPDNMSACDHLEESMFPVDALGQHYIVNAPALTTIPQGKVEVIRVIATAPNTTLSYDPPQVGAPTVIANAGDYVEIAGNAASFEITASAKVLVAQYMEGQQAGGSYGDPAMALAVPVEQYRTSYLFHAPLSYQSNYVDITAPMGASVTLDGASVALTPIGGTGYGFARAEEISDGPNGDGNHRVEGSDKVGISVYGYGQYTSYWYPGGLDFTVILE